MTNNRKLSTEEYKLITSSACSFQILGEMECKVAEAISKPDYDTDNYKIALPKEIYTFDPSSTKLYAMAIRSPNSVSYEAS